MRWKGNGKWPGKEALHCLGEVGETVRRRREWSDDFDFTTYRLRILHGSGDTYVV